MADSHILETIEGQLQGILLSAGYADVFELNTYDLAWQLADEGAQDASSWADKGDELHQFILDYFGTI